jgi:ornithine carbamoyltransferase
MIMAVSLKGRDFVAINDFTREELREFLDVASQIKLRLYAGEPFEPLKGKSLGLIFMKPSTRTRLAFEVAIFQLGGQAIFLSSRDLQLRRGETIEDTGRVLSRYLDGIMIRTFDHRDVVDLADAATIPVINGLTDLLHPTQALADMLTIREKKGRLEGLKLAYIGDGNNMTHSLLYAGAILGLDVSVGCPAGYEPGEDILGEAQELAKATGAELTVVTDPFEAVDEAAVVYTDVWASMGEEEEHEERLRVFQDYQVNSELLQAAREDAIFMHCLPAHRGEEVTNEVIDGPQSVAFDQAENRLHAHKAILALTM